MLGLELQRGDLCLVRGEGCPCHYVNIFFNKYNSVNEYTSELSEHFHGC